MSDETKVRPALTVEEWTNEDIYGDYSPRFRREAQYPLTLTEHALFIGEHRNSAEIDRRGNEDMFHALAALCLHDQPFGFTWEDVDLIRGRAEFGGAHSANKVHDLADRIEALLPPREDE